MRGVGLTKHFVDRTNKPFGAMVLRLQNVSFKPYYPLASLISRAIHSNRDRLVYLDFPYLAVPVMHGFEQC